MLLNEIYYIDCSEYFLMKQSKAVWKMPKETRWGEGEAGGLVRVVRRMIRDRMLGEHSDIVRIQFEY